MSVVVFAGPSLPAASIRGRLDALVLPPAGMGDIARAVRRGPRVIALIDGFFEVQDGVVAGKITPTDAAAQMQAKAEAWKAKQKS